MGATSTTIGLLPPMAGLFEYRLPPILGELELLGDGPPPNLGLG
jgi:hypothetical protein